MNKLVIGLAIGVVLGATISAVANTSSWYSGNDLADRSVDMQTGYVTGVFDAVSMIVDQNITPSQLRPQFTCMDAAGDHTNEYRTWAMTKINQHPQSEAASSIIAHACER